MSEGEGEEIFLARVVSNLRVTVPSKVRERLGLKLGDLVKVRIRKDVKF